MTKQVRQAITPTHILGSTGTAEGDDLGFRALGSFAGDLGPAWPSGSASAPTYTFSGDANTGMFRPDANTLAWSTNGSERMRIDSAGNVGIGTTAPAFLSGYKFVTTNAVNGGGLVCQSNGTNRLSVYNVDSDGFYDVTNNHVFRTGGPLGGTERLRITSNGTIQLPSGSPGIKFGTRNNNLDDYEEGTWTPELVGTTTDGVGTYTDQFGAYTIIGRVCYFDINLLCTAHTGTGNVRIKMPFASASGLQGATGFGYTANIDFTTGTAHAAQIGGGSDRMGVFTYGDNIATANITDFVGSWVYSGFFRL